ncbi:hypothetical protein ACF0H5_021442 [Mactra antiquata]
MEYLFLLVLVLSLWTGSQSESVNHKLFKTGSDDFLISLSTDGTYNISVKGKQWLSSAPTYFNSDNKTFSAADGSLKLLESSASSGTDKIGDWQSQTYLYQTVDSLAVKITANIKIYKDLPIIIFQQIFNDGANWTQGENYEDICGGFPGFKMEGQSGNLGYMSFGGLMVGDTNKHFGQWYNGTSQINEGIAGGPLAWFDIDGHTIVFSPFNNFMSASFSHDKDVGGYYYGGVMGGVYSIPAGHHQDFILYYGVGVNKAFEHWGKTLRKFYGKTLTEQKKDFTITHLGYWTDNGAYYYYNTETGETYEQTMYDVKNYADKVKIPFRYIQYDSWWYYQGVGRGVKTWRSRPDVFPDGFKNVTQTLKLPAAAHNRYWASDTTYAKQNGGKYDFIVEKYKALPVTKQFWVDLFTEAKQWGLILYEQDWLNVEFSGLQALLHDLDLGTQWLTQMAEAASESGIYIQYCMANPRHTMQSLLYPAVTQIRVSNDYNPGGDQWKIGISSILASALGLAPYKDTFWTTEKQPGNIYNRTEPNWKLNAVVSTLSTGPVGPSDMVGATNVSMLMKCCREDGVILKPQYPIRAIDAQIIGEAFPYSGGPGGEVWVSYTQFSSLKFANILALNIGQGYSYTLHPKDTGIYSFKEGNGDLYAVPYDEPYGWVQFSNLYGIDITGVFTPSRIALYHVSQAIPGWFMTTIFGELDKWAPMSPQRVVSVSWTNDTVTAPLIGAPKETFNFWYLLGSKLDAVTCQLSINGTVMFKMDRDLGIATCQ